MPYPRWVAERILALRPAALGSFVKQCLRWNRQLFEQEDGRFFIDVASNFGFRLSSKHGYEPHFRAALMERLKPGMTFVDVGANEGYFSVIASKIVGSSGRVIALEPQSRLQNVVTRNFALNEVVNGKLVRCAISDRDGTADLSLTPDTNTGSTGLFNSLRYATAAEKVPTMRLQSFLAGQGCGFVDVMKMDVEGFEWEAILGSPDVFRNKRISVLMVEIHDAIMRGRGKSPEDLVDFLKSTGYSCHPQSGFTIFKA